MEKSDQVPAAMLLRAGYALDSIMPWAPVPVTSGMILYVFISCMSCRGQYTLSVLAVKICRQAVLQLYSITGGCFACHFPYKICSVQAL